MAAHFRAPIIGQGPSQRHGQAFHLPREAFKGGAGGAAAHLAENDEAGFALHNRAHRRAVEGALDQVSLPVARNQARLNAFGAMDNPQHFRDHSGARQGGAPGAAPWFGLPQRLDHQCLQGTPWLRVNCSIDRLMADALTGIVRMHAPQSGRDLLGRPAPMDQTIADPSVKRSLGHQFAPPTGAPPRRITRQPRHLWIIPTRRGTPRQFKPDGGMMPSEKLANLTQARSPPMFRKDHATFLGVQVLVLAFHGNILCPLGCRCRTSNLSLSFGVPSIAKVTFLIFSCNRAGTQKPRDASSASFSSVTANRALLLRINFAVTARRSRPLAPASTTVSTRV